MSADAIERSSRNLRVAAFHRRCTFPGRREAVFSKVIIDRLTLLSD
jgi:hypothetical protein